MSSTTFTPHRIDPRGRDMLASSCVLPDGWSVVPLPDEACDFDVPTTFLPLLVCMAPYGAVVFSIGARPAFDDGTVEDWAEYLARENNLTIEAIREARVNRMPCIRVDATMPSDMGRLRSRTLFLEDGRRLFTVGAFAPEPIWQSVESDLDRLLGSFRLDAVQGITATPLRLMTSEPSLDLTTDIGALPQSAATSPSMREERDRRARGAGESHPHTGRDGTPQTSDGPEAARAEELTRPSAESATEEAPLDESHTAPKQSANGAASEPPNAVAGEDPELAGSPAWWQAAVRYEREDRLDEAEQAILSALDHIGVYSSVAHLYENRRARLLGAGRHEDAAAAKRRAIHWLYVYASSATSGGEGAALSLERDRRIAALGGEDTTP